MRLRPIEWGLRIQLVNQHTHWRRVLLFSSVFVLSLRVHAIGGVFEVLDVWSVRRSMGVMCGTTDD